MLLSIIIIIFKTEHTDSSTNICIYTRISQIQMSNNQVSFSQKQLNQIELPEQLRTMKDSTKDNSPEDIGTIMEMFAMEYSQAQRIYEASNSNLNMAIERCIKRQKLIPPGLSFHPASIYSKQTPTNGTQSKTGGIAKSTNIQFEGLKNIKERKYEEEFMKIEAEKQEKQRLKSNFKKQYIVKRIELKKKRSLNYKKRSSASDTNEQNEEPTNFISQFEQYLGKPFSHFFKEELNDAFQQLWDTRKFVAIHVLNLTELKELPKNRGSPEEIQRDIMKNFLRDIYLNQKFTTLFSKEFINYGLDPKYFETLTYPHMRQFVNLDRDRFCLIILRLNEKTGKVIKAAKLNIFQFFDPRDFEGSRRKVIDKKKDINRVIDAQICSSIHHNPLNTEQKRKLDEDRKIRNQQQMEYVKMEEKASEARKKQRQGRISRGEQSEEEIERMKQTVIESIIQQKAKERKEARKTLIIYQQTKITNPIRLKLRFPNGQQNILTLPKSETLNYVYQYIFCLEQDLGFENKEQRLFELIQPLQSSFKEKDRSRTLQELFNDSDAQVLIVKQN